MPAGMAAVGNSGISPSGGLAVVVVEDWVVVVEVVVGVLVVVVLVDVVVVVVEVVVDVVVVVVLVLVVVVEVVVVEVVDVGATQLLAPPGVMPARIKSTLFWLVSTPSGHRDMPLSARVELSDKPEPDPSV